MANVKSGSASSRKTPYTFYSQLSFLQRVVKPKNRADNMEEISVDETAHGAEEGPSTSTVHSSEGRRSKRKRSENENTSSDVQQFVTILRDGIRSREEREMSLEKDDDRLFLLSLVSGMKKVPEELRYSVRMQIMQVIDNATKNQNLPFVHHQTQQPSRPQLSHQYPLHPYSQHHNDNTHLTELQPPLFARPTTTYSQLLAVPSPSQSSTASSYSEPEIDDLFS